jgi:putative transposase
MGGMVEYRTSAHAVFDIKYHFVWITKYRYKILRERIAERARDLLRQICQAREAVIIRGGTGSHPRAGVGAAGDGAGQVGAVSEGAVIAEAPRRISGTRKRYWGQHLWARGYFCASVGAVGEETIKKYIENQKWDEEDQGFKITAPTEP